uniref:[histone H3]-trimethyl-L-lysine(9) demethylase n=1 Tax=Nothobranchius furzeri TaxID=105023 RepID=A0A8C6MH26_NOTFU
MTTDTPAQNLGPGVMTFSPSKEEFKDFVQYVAYMESQGAHRAGMAKIIPPKGWKPRKSYDNVDDLVIPAPIQQVVTGQSGLFTQYNIQKKPMTVHEFRKTSSLEKFCSPRYVDFDDLERKFWKNLTINPPLYGADVSGTLYDPDVTEWNISCLNTILDTVENESGVKIKGVNTPYLYFGMWKSAFAWHTEDMDLYSINYLHYGEPKSWYVVPPEHGKRLERLAKGFFPGNAQNCEAFLRHKMTLISPSILKKFSVPFQKVTQEAGQFIITFPFAYHAGFNHGFNCAESTNFATHRWIDYGKQASLCSCRQDMVRISMDVFVRKFQPDRYKLWKAGKDNSPINHSKPTSEASEFLIKDGRKLSKEIPAETSSEEPLMLACVLAATNKKRRQSNSKKEKNVSAAADTSPLEPVERTVVVLSSEEPGVRVDPPVEAKGGPMQNVFQRTLSPADVLHVHSYAKGDYGEDVPPKEEEKSGALSWRMEQVSKVYVITNELRLGCPMIFQSNKSVCCCATEALEELPPVEEGGLEVENWAKPLAHLWNSRPPNLKKEKEYNQRMGSKPPYCSICMLFHTYQQSEKMGWKGRSYYVNSVGSPVVLAGGWMRTKPLIPESCFTTTTEEDAECEEQPIKPYLEDDGSSLLISCSQCSVWVHISCYGVDPASVSKEWKCSRCKANAMTEVSDGWVHVLCAVAVLEARFVNITKRSPVDLSGIPLQRFKLKCYYCKKRMKKASGCCVQCSHGRCPTAYHPTCAQAAGVLMQPDEWPFVVHVTCCRHKGPTQTERNKAAMHELTVGQKVICKHKNGRYYQCDVVQLSKETFYEVNFDDGSFSDNLFPEDIVSRDCTQLGPPPQGDEVQVRWTDGLVYGAKFVAAHVIQMYLVEFEDGSQLTTKRDDVYTLDEELPKRVKSRLSKASDMRFDGIFEENEIIQESKRQRVINSRYRGDYIEPVIYRAIME